MSISNFGYFSVPFQFLSLGVPLPYDLFVNSSKIEGREKYIRVFPKGECLDNDDMGRAKTKYIRLYVCEDQRQDYLKSLTASKMLSDGQKTTIIKDTAIQYLGSVFDRGKEFTTEVLTQTIEGCRDSVESMIDVIQDYSIDKLQDMIANLSFHDFYTYDHSINVSMYCILIARTYNPDADRSLYLHAGMGGMLHDLGKLKVPTNIINKPGKLTDEEFDIIKKHPGYGLSLLNTCNVEGMDLNTIARVVNEHHENFNGTGYPQQLDGEKIHVLARIAAIADFFDAITTKRSYHEVRPIDEALTLMAKSKGKKLDPNLFDFFTQHIKHFALAGRLNVELPDDFDPCQPQNELPYQKSKIDDSNKTFGKIKIEEDEETNDKTDYGKFTIKETEEDELLKARSESLKREMKLKTVTPLKSPAKGASKATKGTSKKAS